MPSPSLTTSIIDPRRVLKIRWDGLEELHHDEHVPGVDHHRDDERPDSGAQPQPAAPVYPDSLRRAGVEGSVTVQFVVDTMGHIEIPSFVLLESSHGRFTESVRAALPRMLFRPAELRGQKIKQLVQIPFVFRIQPSDTAGTGDPAAVHDTTSGEGSAISDQENTPSRASTGRTEAVP